MSSKKNPHAVLLGSLGGRKRAKTLSSKRRSDIARLASKARWAKRNASVAGGQIADAPALQPANA